MAERENITPEERLLHIIRNSKKKVAASVSSKLTPQPAPEKPVSKITETPVAQSAPSIVQPKKIAWALLDVSGINFVVINRLLIVSILLGISFFVYDIFFSQVSPQNSRLSSPKSQRAVAPKPVETKPFSYYEQEINKRSLFLVQALRTQASPMAPVGPTFQETIKDLSLSGVAMGEVPQAVIEDRKTGKTYFLSEGDYLGEVKIERIESNKVIVELKGERATLFL